MLSQTDKALDLAERFGGSTAEGEFAPSRVPISRIARDYSTPFYLYSGELIVERVRSVKEATDAGFRPCKLCRPVAAA